MSRFQNAQRAGIFSEPQRLRELSMLETDPEHGSIAYILSMVDTDSNSIVYQSTIRVKEVEWLVHRERFIISGDSVYLFMGKGLQSLQCLSFRVSDL